MLQFGFVRIQGRLMVYEVTLEHWGGRDVYVATRSDDPRVRFSADAPAAAVAQLLRYQAGLRPRRVVPVYDMAGKQVIEWGRVTPRMRGEHP